jgi:hypothetical protein
MRTAAFSLFISNLSIIYEVVIGQPTKYLYIQSTTVYVTRRNWDSPNPSPASKCAPSPNQRVGGTLACGWGVGGIPFPEKNTLPTLWASPNRRHLCDPLTRGFETIRDKKTWHSLITLFPWNRLNDHVASPFPYGLLWHWQAPHEQSPRPLHTSPSGPSIRAYSYYIIVLRPNS